LERKIEEAKLKKFESQNEREEESRPLKESENIEGVPKSQQSPLSERVRSRRGSESYEL